MEIPTVSKKIGFHFDLSEEKMSPRLKRILKQLPKRMYLCTLHDFDRFAYTISNEEVSRVLLSAVAVLQYEDKIHINTVLTKEYFTGLLYGAKSSIVLLDEMDGDNYWEQDAGAVAQEILRIMKQRYLIEHNE